MSHISHKYVRDMGHPSPHPSLGLDKILKATPTTYMIVFVTDYTSVLCALIRILVNIDQSRRITAVKASQLLAI